MKYTPNPPGHATPNNRGIFAIQSAGKFRHQPFYLPQQPFGNCYCPTSVFETLYDCSLQVDTTKVLYLELVTQIFFNV